MTKEEAEAKACCGPRNNAQTAEDSDVLCIGSRCMAWRTQREDHYYNAHGGLEDGPRVVDYCGLAGKP